MTAYLLYQRGLTELATINSTIFFRLNLGGQDHRREKPSHHQLKQSHFHFTDPILIPLIAGQEQIQDLWRLVSGKREGQMRSVHPRNYPSEK